MVRRGLFVFLMLAMVVSGRVLAHANLVQAEPPPNAILDAAPAEIRLWFTEPLEPDFSRIILRDRDGNILETLPSQVDLTDRTQMILVPGNLPDGLYTVAWRALSTADGHPTQGSYPIIVGEVAGGFGAATQAEATIPVDGTLIRWANLMSLALTVGGISFWMFVWTPSVPEGNKAVERRIGLLIWIGWLTVGITGAFLLFMQLSLATGNPLLQGIDGDSLNSLVVNTRFGQLWLARMALWVGLAGALWFAVSDHWFRWIALMIGGAILAINSLFSHANAAHDQLAAVSADWLHLLAMTLWVGGLVQFISVIGPVRKHFQPAAPTLNKLVAHFTNFARVSVVALFITGLYSTWLQVGVVEGLWTTGYGQALLLKIILIIPIIGIAFVNMVYTYRGLASGGEIWGTRLRRLIGVEIALTAGVLLTVGMMTSTAPARATLAQRAANPPPPQPQPIIETLVDDDLTLELTINPGWIGENTFSLKLTDAAGQPVEDATLIRMRFESQTQNLGESELRPETQGGGVYTITAANLSVPGEWRIRTTVQRPDKFDALADFKPDVQPIPEPPLIVPIPPPDAPLPNRTLVMLAAGLMALAVGGFFVSENQKHLLRASVILGVGLVLLGGVLLVSATQGTEMTHTTSAAFQPQGNMASKLVAPSESALPYLITGDGALYVPNENNIWTRLALEAKVSDAYIDNQKTIWVATDLGVYAYKNDEWVQISIEPVTRLDMMHGYLFALGMGAVTRIPAGGAELARVRVLPIPITDQPATELVMLGNHNHVIENGDKLYLTPDLGLSWQPIELNSSVQKIWVNTDGNLLATTADGMLIWNYVGQTWSDLLPLPGDDANAIFRAFDERMFAVAGGNLYVLAGSQWTAIPLPDSENAYLTGLAFQYPRTLWTLDARGARLWSTTDGKNWTLTPITLN
ncbi:MAG: copper resistance protein CopC [Anaerolineae bacterium]|nr:copper resistance protein CopC [Anaerolineae bacterium]